jgi:hypothetical protein
MNVDRILQAFAQRGAVMILIGGMNFLLRHRPVLTYDVDLWVRDSDDNLARVSDALRDLGAEWGMDEKSWAPIPPGSGWLRRQPVFCLTTREGAVDIFREVRGLESGFEACWARSEKSQTAEGIPFHGLSDADMLACQLGLPESERNAERVAYFQARRKPN